MLKNTHNHLRICRLLAFLSITGFRHLALNLLRFLEEQIANERKYERLMTTFKEKFMIYGDENKEEALRKWCFCETDDFPKPNPIWHKVFGSDSQEIDDS